MPTYAPTFTPRYRVKYRAAGIEHTVLCRGPRGANLVDMTTRGNSFSTMFGALTAVLADDFEWISADVALTDEDTWAPTTVPATVTGVAPVANFTIMQRIMSTTFSGRAPGSKARFSLYGFAWTPATLANVAEDFILTGAEIAGIATIVTEASGHFFAGSGQAASFYNRATVKVNDFLLKKARRGIL